MSYKLTAGVLGRRRRESGVLLPQTILYRDRVISDTGEIISLSNLNKQIKREVDADNYENLVLWVDSNAGFKLVGDKIEKAYDISGEDNDAVQTTPANQPVLVSDGIEFDGNNDNLQVLNTELTESTVSLWMKTTITAQNGVLIGGVNKTIVTPGVALEIRNANDFFIYRLVKVENIVPLLSNGEWHHILVQINASSVVECYIDNDLKTTVTEGAGRVSGELRIGSRGQSGTPSVFFGGTLNDIRIYNKALSAAEINKIYNDTKGIYGI